MEETQTGVRTHGRGVPARLAPMIDAALPLPPTPAPSPDAPPLVLLDLDGTLTDSAPGIMDSARTAFEALGLPPLTPEQLRGFVGPPLVEGLRHAGVPEERLAEGVRAYRAYFAKTGMWDNRVFDGVPGQLRALRAAGCSLAVATSKPEIYARPICERFGLAELVDGVYGAPTDDVPSTKATVIAHALTELAAMVPPLMPPPGRIVMVGDRRHDIEGASAHGIPCLGAGWGYGTPDELAGAVAVVPDVAGLASAVLALLHLG